MSEAVRQFVLMVQEAYGRSVTAKAPATASRMVEDEQPARKITRRMYCDVCGMETLHVLEIGRWPGDVEWEALKCTVCAVGAHWYRVK